MLSQSLKDDVFDMLKDEGDVRYMYLDTKGNVTIGIGTMLPDLDAASKVNFLRNIDSKPASAADIQAAWTKINKEPSGQKYAATYYQGRTDLYITADEEERLVSDKLESIYKQMIGWFPNFETFPRPGRLALFDMAYNVGDLTLKFPTLVKDVQRVNPKTKKPEPDWKAAGDQCHRVGISDQRNKDTLARFQAAALQSPVNADDAKTSN